MPCPYGKKTGRWHERGPSGGSDKIGDLRFVGVADDEGDAGKGGDFIGGALGVTAGDDDLSIGIGGMEFADGVAGLGVGGSSDGARVDYDHVGGGGGGCDCTTAI